MLFSKCCAFGLFVLSIFIYSSVVLAATTINVPGDFLTIQGAIDAASNGDTIIVVDGTYTGEGNKNLDFNGKAITVQSENGPESTIIDCENSGRGFYFHSGEGNDSVVSGFTITNGFEVIGGGMYITNSSPTVNNCIFSGNSATQSPPFGMGGGMIILGASSPLVTNCSFSGNDGDVYGGGIYNASSSPLTIENCSFSNNTAHQGGGMYNDSSSPVVSNCTFSGNSATQYAGYGIGGGMYNVYASPMVSNCTFINNQAYYRGGGMANQNSSSPIVTNCIFSGNSTTDHSPSSSGGGGMFNGGSSSATITNSIFFQNATLYGSGLRFDSSSATINNCSFSENNGTTTIYIVDNSAVTITNSIMWGDIIQASFSELDGTMGGGSYSVSYSDIWGGYAGTRNINKDPKFVDQANGDLHLQQDSPCIDAGDNDATPLPATDIDGDNRKIDIPAVADTGNGTPPIVDMGADEFRMPENYFFVIPNPNGATVICL